MTVLLLKGVLAYLLGSIVGSLLLGRLRGVDIRALGSGNAGGTNALRTQGKRFGLGVLAIDIGKGWLATAVLARMTIAPLDSAAIDPQWTVAVCGMAVILGHVYPLWYGRRGGKGVATLIGAVLGLAPLLLAPMLLAWLLTVILSGYVGLGSMLGAVAFVVTAALRPQTRGPLLVFATLAALLVIYTHRANVARMRAGTEPRARRLWLLGLRARSS
ncbi:MAG: glycerol-3-phosphate 1-O-acyltransferase PlsY [Steroidobacteraceae bacterium]